MKHAWLGMMLFAWLGCGGGSGDARQSYRVRARVVEVTGQGADMTVVLEHEAIPRFLDRDGKPGPMPAMKMAFGVAPGLERLRFHPQSPWSVEFDVAWERSPVLMITRAEPLPAGTTLALPGEN